MKALAKRVFNIEQEMAQRAKKKSDADQGKVRMRFWQYVGFKVGISYPTNFIRYEEGIKYIYEHSGEEEIDVEFSTSERVFEKI